MDVIEAVNKRKSIRSFRPDTVPRDTLAEMLKLALRAPSWANTQPWEFAVVTGKKLDEIRKGFVEKAEEEPNPDLARPQEFPEPYDSRNRAHAVKFLEIKGIKREDREKRGWWRVQGLKHFGAPCVIYLLIDRSFYFQKKSINVWPAFDCGLIAENIMILATKYGLGTTPQAQAVAYPDVVRKVLGVPESKLIVLGIAIGYPDWEDPINRFISERESLDKVSKWYGFE